MNQIARARFVTGVVVAGAALVWSAAAPDVSSNEGCATEPTVVSIRGSSNLFELASEWAIEYGEKNSSFVGEVVDTGSGEGIKDLLEGRADIAMASRLIKDEELAIARKSRLEIRETMVAQTGVAVIVNPANPTPTIAINQIGDVFAGEVRNWKDLGGPDEPIVVVYKTSGNTPRLFREEVLGNRPYTSDAVIADSKEDVVDEVGNRGWSIGFTGLGQALAAQERVRFLLLEYEMTGQGATFALKRPLYFYTVGAEPEVDGFIEFVLGDQGQASAVGPGLFPVN